MCFSLRDNSMKYLFKWYLILLGLTLFFIIMYGDFTSDLSLFKRTKDYYHLVETTDLKETDEITALNARIPNLPIKFWYSRKDLKMRINDSCAVFPDILNFNYVHSYWQRFTTSNGTIKLFGAYLDDRNGSNRVRILAMIDRRTPNVKTFCQLWFHDSQKPIIVPVYEYFFLWHEYWGWQENGFFQPYLLSCELPNYISFGVPAAVSLTEEYCGNATNSLVVNYKKPKVKKNFAVCIKGMNFMQDISVRLVEWIELLRLVGVEKIFFYDIITHPYVMELLKYYQKQNLVEISTLTLSKIRLNEPFMEHLYLQLDANMQEEVIPYNDCYLKHMHEYNYISVLDVDEMIMPKGELTTWKDLLSKARSDVVMERGIEAAAYVARNSYFFDNHTREKLHRSIAPDEYETQGETLKDVPSYMHMLRHVYRSQNFTPPGYYVKSIHNTRAVLAVHNHMPLATLDDDKYQTYDFPLDDAYMHHYRADCPGEMQDICYNDYRKDVVFDDTIFKYKDKLRRNVIETLDALGYY